jgi:hypothetical protein
VALQPSRAQAAVNTVPKPKLVRMRSRWLVYRPNTLTRIILIQQPEPSGGEAGESRVTNKSREIWPTKHLTRALLGSFTCRKFTTWDRRLYFPSEGSARYGFLSPIKIHRPRPDRNPQLRVPWVPWQEI